MKRLILLAAAAALVGVLVGQQAFKPNLLVASQPSNIDAENLDFNGLPQAALPSAAPNLLQERMNMLLGDRLPANLGINLPTLGGLKVVADPEDGQPIAIFGRPAPLGRRMADKTDAYAYLSEIGALLKLADPLVEILITSQETDELGQLHVRLQQVYKGLEVVPADARLHAQSVDSGFDFYAGRLFPSPDSLNMEVSWTAEAAADKVKAMDMAEFVALSEEQLKWVSGPQWSSKLVVYYREGKAYLAYQIETRPNLAKHYTTYLDAHTGAVLNRYGHTCGLMAPQHLAAAGSCVDSHPSVENQDEKAALPPDGPYTTNVLNLFDQTVTINTFSLQDTFYLLDGSRPMFNVANNNIDGFILTYDGLGGSPQLNSFSPTLSISLNNTNWSKTAASVHSNAGTAYQYFLDAHGRNSIDGAGGNVYSFMNINEPDGTQMDNAFWNGRALFYGNGNQAFFRLPRGLDVAGHEMAHGVIQSTADLIYQEQAGALNESFADVFGYLVEGESGDFRIGEDVVNPSVFTSGTMRNMQNPNNGAAGPQDFRWQPAHMDQYQDLPVNADNDNGGVHINSGIPNRAFYLFASAPGVGDERAARVYYRALSTYLTRSSRFADLRIAVVQAASDLYGAAVVAAANAAFDEVGIGGSGGNYTVDLESNEGDRFLLLSNVNQSALYVAQEDGSLLNNPLAEVGLRSKPSLTDDGRFAVFVDSQGRLRVYNFSNNQLGFIENNPGTNWRNVAINKDGNRLAVTTTDNDNRILIFDFESGIGRFYTIFNPTTASGISTGDVLYTDALEWEPEGEFLMYDAESRLDDGITYWDIGFLRAWDRGRNDFGDGYIIKLDSNLPAGKSIGNPTFTKNSPYIIAFEEVDFAAGQFNIIGANMETGSSSIIFENSMVNYPNYGVGDDRLVFDAQTNQGARVLAVVPLGSDKISASGSAAILVEGGHWGAFFANGARDLNTATETLLDAEALGLLVFPSPFQEVLNVQLSGDQPASVQLQLFDFLGRQVMSAQHRSSTDHLTLSTAGLAAGTYFLHIRLPSGRLVKKVLKQ